MIVRTVTLSAGTWGSAIEALRFAAHTDPDEAYMGVDQDEAHRAADHMAEQIGYDVPCQGCEVEAEMKADEEQTPATDDHSPAAEGIRAARVDAEDERCGHSAPSPHGCLVCLGEVPA